MKREVYRYTLLKFYKDENGEGLHYELMRQAHKEGTELQSLIIKACWEYLATQKENEFVSIKTTK